MAIALVLGAAVVYTLGGWCPGRCWRRWPRSRRRRRCAGGTWHVPLSWNVATGVAPLLYAWLLDLGSLPAWFGMAAITLAGAVMTIPMRRQLDHAGRVVTNRAEGAPV